VALFVVAFDENDLDLIRCKVRRSVETQQVRPDMGGLEFALTVSYGQGYVDPPLTFGTRDVDGGFHD
jgi:hypothetical protein